MAYTSTRVWGPFKRLHPFLLRIWRKKGSTSACPPQSAQLLLAESSFVHESSKQLREPRAAKVVFVFNLFTAWGPVVFQVPQI
jgi:hypothetical protein